MSQIEKARRFAALHVKGAPLVLTNVWDAGSARAVAEAGAPALATSSWAVAAAQGYDDGEHLPLDLHLTIAERIAAATGVPVSIDFEGGYADTDDALAANIRRLIATGVVGLNFEDRLVRGEGLHSIEAQAGRIRLMRQIADALGLPLFINARTDLFLQADAAGHGALIAEAVQRAEAYKAAGASGFFVPGLAEPSLVESLCGAVELPVNLMLMAPPPSHAPLARLGVARISYGPSPYIGLMSGLKARAQAA